MNQGERDAQRFGSLKEEAKLNVDRIDPLGVQLQANTLRLLVQPGLAKLAAAGEPDTRCGTCAARVGTVPGGCIQTQADFLKAIMEDVPFMCHAHEVDGAHPMLCHGWYAARQIQQSKVDAPWPWADDAGKATP